MEKFRIAQYGFIQMVALSYALLVSGMTVKAARYLAERDIPLTPYYRVVWFFHDYGILLAAVIIGWAVFCAFHSTIFSRRNVDERGIVASGLVLSGLFFVLAIFLTFAGMDALFAPQV